MRSLVEQIPANLFFALVGAAALAVVNGMWRAVRHSVRRHRRMKRANTLNEAVSRSEFSFGGLQASIFVADFQPDGYLPDLVRCTLGPPSSESTSTVPDSEVAPHLATWNERLSAAEIFNGSVLALRSITIDRTAELERPGLRLTFTESDYVTQRATTAAFRALSHERRGELADQVRLGGGAAGRYSSTFGVSLTVVTADDQLVWLRRSESSAVNPGRYTCTTAEGMNRDDVRSGAPDPFLCAARGLHEELGIRLSSSELAEIRLTALTLNLDWWEWNLLGHIRLSDLTGHALDSNTIRQYFQSARAKDKWESADVVFTPCRPRDVAAFIREHAITNYGAVAAVLALLADRRFRREEVAAAFAGSPVRIGEFDERRTAQP